MTGKAMPNNLKQIHCKYDDGQCMYFVFNEKKPNGLDCIACSLREIATEKIKEGNDGNKNLTLEKNYRG